MSAISITEIRKKLLSNDIDVDTRTVRRDIEELSNGRGLVETDDYPAKYFISPDYELEHKLKLNEDTLEVLLMALNNLKHTSHSYFYEHATSAENAILNNLKEKTNQKLIKQKKNYYYDYSMSGKPNTTDHTDFNKILKAMRTKKVITCQNHSPYKNAAYNEQLRQFAPLVFILTSGTPYLLVKDLKDDKLKKIRITRLKYINITDIDCDIPNQEEFNLESGLGGFGGTKDESERITIMCDEVLGTYFEEKIIHKSQEVIKHSETSYEIHLECTVSSELSRLLASFGGHLTSVTPKEIQSSVEEIWNSGLKKVS